MTRRGSALGRVVRRAFKGSAWSGGWAHAWRRYGADAVTVSDAIATLKT